MTIFYIVRHGETDWNVAGKLQGQTDIPLNDNGRLQAKNVAQALKDVEFDLAFSSDLLRAKETAEIIALEHTLEVEMTKLLRERNFGEHEGKTHEEIKTYDELFRALSDTDKVNYKYSPSSESDQDLITRFITFLRETALTHPDKTILVGTHAGMMRSLLIHLGYLSYEHGFRAIANGAYAVLETDGIDFFVKKTEGIKKGEQLS